jgi:hypothetical protein
MQDTTLALMQVLSTSRTQLVTNDSCVQAAKIWNKRDLPELS